MPTPNAPSSETGTGQIQSPQLFAESTERQELPQATAAIKGLGERQQLLIEKVGVIARARILITGSFETEAEAATLASGFPQRLIKSLQLSANGVTGIISCGGMTLEQRRRRVFRNPVKSGETTVETGKALTASHKYEFAFTIDVPIAHDMETLIGCLLAQNQQTELALDITWATEGELVSSKKITKFEGEVKWDTTTFSIGTITQGKREVTVLPDLSAFHGLLEQSTTFTGTGEKETDLTRTDGQLLCYTASVFNGPHAELSPAEWDTFYLQYGANRRPRVWTPASQLLECNADDYDGPLEIAGIHFLAVDNEADNPARDMMIPADLTELMAKIGVPSGTVIAENSSILSTQETLYPAV